MIQPGIYKITEQLLPLLDIPKYQYNRRKNELLEWFKNFYDYEIIMKKPAVMEIKEVYGDYQPLPRKVDVSAQKQQDYDEYVKNHLSIEFTPESKAHMARKAINDFAYDKYFHMNDAAVARRYVGPAMERLGEKSDNYCWVYFDTYEKLTDEHLDKWKSILEKEHIGEKEAATAFYRQEQGEDITEEKNAYKAALECFKALYGTIPVKVREWRIGRK